jgi:hypothetical protein
MEKNSLSDAIVRLNFVQLLTEMKAKQITYEKTNGESEDLNNRFEIMAEAMDLIQRNEALIKLQEDQINKLKATIINYKMGSRKLYIENEKLKKVIDYNKI